MLGPRDRVIGQMYIEGDLRVGGVLEGDVEVTGDLEIDDMAKVKASLAGRDVNIRGHVNGAVVARKRLIVARSGSLIGDVRVERLVIQDGATFSGQVSMGPGASKAAPPKPVEAPSPPPPEPEPEAKVVVVPAEKPVPPPVTAPVPPALVISPPAVIKTAAPAPIKTAAPAPIKSAPAPVAELRVAGKDGKGKSAPPPITRKPDKKKKKGR
jgi:cytoskeletal protein CcmA (bactofilin family)